MSNSQCKTPVRAEDKPPQSTISPVQAAEVVSETLFDAGIWNRDSETARHHVSPTPFLINREQIEFLDRLGDAIWSFYNALNNLWLRKGNDWAKEWLDQGKPSWLLDIARMNYSKRHIPRLMRPDLMFCDDGMWVTELDSVPGGAGQTAAMAKVYADSGWNVVGGGDGIVEQFDRTVSDLTQNENWSLAIVVSDESEDYRAEMTHLAARLRESGRTAWCVHPRDVLFDEEGLWLDSEGARARIDVLWRFFELFDLRNIPKHELVIYASKKRKVVVSPPYKPHLEEKLALALLQQEGLADFWSSEMGEDFEFLRSVVPETWVLDPSPVPSHAEISRLQFRGKPVRDFLELTDASQKERRLVIKPSGFSPLSWGGKGVSVGHDLSQEDWEQTLKQALNDFWQTPHVLQNFHEGKRIKMDYLDPSNGEMGTMSGRARLTPYYYVADDKPMLSGVLATICPDDKKLIHGMTDSIMTVCAEGGSGSV